MSRKWINNAKAVLASDILATATSLTVQAGQGDRFPAVNTPDYFFITIQNASNDLEIMKVTQRVSGSDVMTVERAQEGTVARAWATGDVIELRLTASALTLYEGAVETLAEPNFVALKNLAGAADNLIYFDTPTTLALSPLSPFIRTLLDDADAATARTTLGVSSTSGDKFLNEFIVATANFSIDSTYRGKYIQCIGVGAITLAAASALGNGFAVIIENRDISIITISPNGTDLINGTNSFSLQPAEVVLIVCDGTSSFKATYVDRPVSSSGGGGGGDKFLNALVATNASLTLDATYRGKFIEANAAGPISMALPAASSLENGWSFVLNNTGTDSIVVQPNGSDTIGGQTSLLLNKNESALIVCNGINNFGFIKMCCGAGTGTTGSGGGSPPPGGPGMGPTTPVNVLPPTGGGTDKLCFPFGAAISGIWVRIWFTCQADPAFSGYLGLMPQIGGTADYTQKVFVGVNVPVGSTHNWLGIIDFYNVSTGNWVMLAYTYLYRTTDNVKLNDFVNVEPLVFGGNFTGVCFTMMDVNRNIVSNTLNMNMISIYGGQA